MRVFYILSFSFSLFLFSSCSDHSDPISDNCPTFITDQALFSDLDANSPRALSLALVDDCLLVTLGISGCDADHEVDFITDGAIADSSVPLIVFGILDKKPQACEAYFEIDHSFDLSELKSLAIPSIQIQFVNSEVSIIYWMN